MTDTPHPFDGQFEPPAEAAAKGDPRIPLSEIAAASTAISLKRIADSLSTSGAQDLLSDIHHTVTNLAHEAGMAFQSGANRNR